MGALHDKKDGGVPCEEAAQRSALMMKGSRTAMPWSGCAGFWMFQELVGKPSSRRWQETAESWFDPPSRPGKPILLPAIQEAAAEVWHASVHESQGELLRQPSLPANPSRFFSLRQFTRGSYSGKHWSHDHNTLFPLLPAELSWLKRFHSTQSARCVSSTR